MVRAEGQLLAESGHPRVRYIEAACPGVSTDVYSLVALDGCSALLLVIDAGSHVQRRTLSPITWHSGDIPRVALH